MTVSGRDTLPVGMSKKSKKAIGSQEEPVKTVNKKGQPVSTGRSAGRPRGRFLPKYEVDWEFAESYYVQGMIIEEKGRGKSRIERRHPSFADVARKFKCSKAAVHYQAKKRSWRNKREQYNKFEAEAIQKKVAEARAISFSEGEAMIDRWIARFSDHLEKGDVRTDSIQDLDKAMRTKAFLRGQVESRIEVRETLSLSTLQDSHKETRARAEKDEEESAEASAGVIAAAANDRGEGSSDGGSPLH